MTMDTTVMVYGFIKERGIGQEPPMTWSWENPDAGFMLSTLVDPWLLYPLINMLKGPRYALYWPRWKNILGVMIKLKDEISGGVFPDGRISKPMTARDRERLKIAEEVSRKILVECRVRIPHDIYDALRGTPPQRDRTHGTMSTRLGYLAKGLYAAMPAPRQPDRQRS
jgi:hypothetical protein